MALRGEGKCSKSLFGKPEETGEHLYDAGVDGKTAVEWSYNIQCGTDWTEFTCFRVGTNGKILWTRWRISGVHNMQTIRSVVEKPLTISYKLLVSQLHKGKLANLLSFLSLHQATAKPHSSTVGTPGTRHTHTDRPYRNRETPLSDYTATAGIKPNKYTHARTLLHDYAFHCYSWTDGQMKDFRFPATHLATMMGLTNMH